MAKPVDMLPHGCDERCEACAFPLQGLPMKGRCPKCGTRYAFVFLFRRTALSSEACGSTDEPGCGYSLRGLPLRGHCPECGRTYWFDRPRRQRPSPRFRDLVSHAAVRIGVPSTGMMIGVFILMIAAAMGIILWSLWHRIDAIFFQPFR
jgi:rRNA maturation protein Nop10